MLDADNQLTSVRQFIEWMLALASTVAAQWTPDLSQNVMYLILVTVDSLCLSLFFKPTFSWSNTTRQALQSDNQYHSDVFVVLAVLIRTTTKGSTEPRFGQHSQNLNRRSQYRKKTNPQLFEKY